jgi:hypothetical protein
MLQRPNPLANRRQQAAANKIFVSLPTIPAQAKFVQAIPMTGMAGYAGTGQREPSCQWAWRRPACRIKSEVNCPQQHPAGTGLGNFALGKLEIVLRGLAARARREQNLVVLCRLSRFGRICGLRFH